MVARLASSNIHKDSESGASATKNEKVIKYLTF